MVKGVEYNIGDDELELPDDPKGDTKVDAEGRLQGGKSSNVVGETLACEKPY
jgi:chromatin structure-remodeling complex protein RSC7